MDSRLLNSYHDDPYEVYESNITDVWSTDNIEIQLEHTLDGILPIRATEVENESYCNVFYADDHIFSDKNINSNALVYNDFEEQQLRANERVGTIDDNNVIGKDEGIIEVNIFDAVSNLLEDDGDDHDDARSQYSQTSFRTRTDSSSIGDYESHSSDYDDESEYESDEVNGDDDDEHENYINGSNLIGASTFEKNDLSLLEADDLLTDLPGLNLLNGEQFMFIANGAKQRTMSTNTIGSDVDAATFDLAEFITKDDDLLAKAANSRFNSPKKLPQTVNMHVKTEIAADSDSDAIVDVETVEVDEIKKGVSIMKHEAATATANEMAEDNLTFVDNVKADPEWNPKEVKPKCNKSIAAVSTPKGGKLKKAHAPIANGNKIATPTKAINNKKQILKSTQTNVQILSNKRTHGIGKGGKNLALLKRDCESIEANAKTENKGKDLALFKHDSNCIADNKQNTSNNNNNNNSNMINNNNKTINNKITESAVKTKTIAVETEKRKLNLAEYKRRYAGEDLSKLTKPKLNNSTTKPPHTTTATAMPPQTSKQTPATTTTITKPTAGKPLNLSPLKVNKPHSEAVTSIVKTLKEQQQNQAPTNPQNIDPITLARNKVLRMQELKRAQQMKIIDSTVSAKVPRVTKLLPLQEIIKDTAYAVKTDKDDKFKTNGATTYDNHPDYERIVMVSVACNTALTLSPHDVLPNVPLLENISHNSLITSIQDAVVKQSLPKIKNVGTTITPNKAENQQTKEAETHGEDKIIMHLRKDRERENNARSIEIQTDFQAAFPILPLPKYLRKLRQSRRKYRKFDSTNGTSLSSGMDSSQSDNDDDEFASNSRSCGGAAGEYTNSELTTGDAAGGGGTGSVGGYSSRSSRRHRSSVSSSYSESGHPQRSSRNHKRQPNYRKSLHKKTRSSSASSTASSLSDYSDRSHSRGHRSRTRSPLYGNSNVRRESNFGDRNVSKPAVEERRIVYVGRIEEETSKEMLRRKFIAYGAIRQITVHYKENGMKYGFVTFERSEDAFTVIDNSARDNQVNMYDISFGGRRAFCRTSYADLDNAGINNYHSYVFPKAPAPPKQEDSFEALLKKMKAKLDASKTTSATTTSTADEKL